MDRVAGGGLTSPEKPETNRNKSYALTTESCNIHKASLGLTAARKGRKHTQRVLTVLYITRERIGGETLTGREERWLFHHSRWSSVDRKRPGKCCREKLLSGCGYGLSPAEGTTPKGVAGGSLEIAEMAGRRTKMGKSFFLLPRWMLLPQKNAGKIKGGAGNCRSLESTK